MNIFLDYKTPLGRECFKVEVFILWRCESIISSTLTRLFVITKEIERRDRSKIRENERKKERYKARKKKRKIQHVVVA